MVQCDRCGGDAGKKGSLILWPDGTRRIYCGECSNPFHDAFPGDAGAEWEFWWGWREEETEAQLPPYELKYFTDKRLHGFCFDLETGVTKLTFENGWVEAKIISAKLKE